MAKLIGFLKYGHHAGVVHRLAHQSISSDLRTWHGKVETTLWKDGRIRVIVDGKTVYSGQVEP